VTIAYYSDRLRFFLTRINQPFFPQQARAKQVIFAGITPAWRGL
jgi:hypothetical protein